MMVVTVATATSELLAKRFPGGAATGTHPVHRVLERAVPNFDVVTGVLALGHRNGLVHFRRHVLQISPALVLIPTTTYCKAALFGFAVAVPLVARAAVGVALVNGGSRLISVAPGPRRLVVLEVLVVQAGCLGREILVADRRREGRTAHLRRPRYEILRTHAVGLQVQATAAGVGQVQHLALFLTEHLHLHRAGLGEPVATHGQATLLALTVAPARSTITTLLIIAGRLVWHHGTVPVEVAPGPHLPLWKEVGRVLANGCEASAIEALVDGPTLTGAVLQQRRRACCTSGISCVAELRGFENRECS
mmetsp:Transcript_102097/g.243496  ORF Transcript_102097/g.243496 Transcript_102097/m.243496 type:complete len:306 (-) Transcript_102097:89-1006(-)